MEAAIQLKKGVANDDIFRIIIGKFSHWQEPCQVILLVVDKGLEVGFHSTVLSFCLTVRLGVESGRQFSLYV